MGGTWEKERRWKGEGGTGLGIRGDRDEIQSKNFEQRCGEMRDGELRITTSNSQMLGKQEAPRTELG